MTLINGQANSVQLNRKAPEWLPSELNESYNKTDIDYEFCVKLFFQLEASKRERIPTETARQWFIEFIRKGWTKKMLQARYDALLDTKIFGVDKLDFSDWVNAVPVRAMDEVNLMIKDRIESLIARGKYLKDKNFELSEDDKKAIDLAVAKEIEFKYQSGMYEARETYQEERRRLWRQKFGVEK